MMTPQQFNALQQTRERIMRAAQDPRNATRWILQTYKLTRFAAQLDEIRALPEIQR